MPATRARTRRGPAAEGSLSPSRSSPTPARLAFSRGHLSPAQSRLPGHGRCPARGPRPPARRRSDQSRRTSHQLQYRFGVAVEPLGGARHLGATPAGGLQRPGVGGAHFQIPNNTDGQQHHVRRRPGGPGPADEQPAQNMALSCKHIMKNDLWRFVVQVLTYPNTSPATQLYLARKLSILSQTKGLQLKLTMVGA